MNKNLNTAAFTALTAASLALSAQADITTGLVGYWKFDDGSGSSTAVDSSGNGNTGTLTQFAVADGFTTMWTTAPLGEALAFNQGSETSNHIAVADAADLNFSGTKQFTIAAWAKPTTTSQTSSGGLICKGGAGTEEYCMEISSSKFAFFMRSSSSTAATTLLSTPALVANTWYHVVCVYSNSPGGLTIYINGAANASETTSVTTVETNAHPLTIGARDAASATNGVYQYPFKGVLDEVHVYNRALTASDVFQLYTNNDGTPVITTQPRSVNCYLGDSPALTVAASVSSNLLAVGGYQWQFDGTNIPGATTTSLVVSNAVATNAGTYTVTLTNYIGTTISSNAILTLHALPAANTTTGLVGYWKFDDASGSSTAADSSGNGNSGTLSGFADTTFTTMWTNGLIGGALVFNADGTSNNVVAIPSVGGAGPAVLDFSTNGATQNPVFTLAAWVQVPATNINGAVIARGTGNGGEQYVIENSGGHYRFYVRDTNATVWIAQSAIAPNGLWQHVAGVLDGNNGIMNLYVNGELAAPGVAPFTLITSATTNAVSIGNRLSNAVTNNYVIPLTGLIDDVHVYNRALTSADIYALYLLGGASPPVMVNQPQSVTNYVGDNLKLTALASGTVPMFYQWVQNGTAVIASGTTASLSFSLPLTPSVASNAGTYTLVLTNVYGATNSSQVIVTLTPFTLTSALAGYWTFDDGPGTCTAADSSTNGNNGTLNDFPDCTSEWVTGRINECITFNTPPAANQYVDVPDAPSLDFNANLAFSLAAWVRGPATQVNSAGILCKGYGAEEQYAMDVEGGFYRFFLRNAANTAVTLLTTVAPNGRWQHLAATYDGNFGLMTFYVNGQPVATNTAAPNTLMAENSHDVSIGCREANNTAGYNLPFDGAIDDVRIYSRTLSANDVQTLYQAAGILAPVFYTQPQGGLFHPGVNYTLSASVDGTAPLSFQWQFDNGSIAGATNSSLVLSDLQLTNAGTYTLLVSNASGPLLSSNAVVSVTALPSLTAPYPQKVLNDHPIGYWPLNEVPDNGFGNNGTVAYDYISNNFGIYTNAVLGNQGYAEALAAQYGYTPASDTNSSAGFGSFALSNSCVNLISNINFALPTNNNAAFSVEAWVALTANTVSAIVTKGYGGGGEEFGIDTGTTAHAFRFFVRNAAGTAYDANSTIVPQGGIWYHLVGVCDEVNSNVAVYVNGVLAGTGAIPPVSGIVSDDAWPMTIGARSQNQTSGNSIQTTGYMNNVAIYNYALTASNVAGHYNAAGIGPALTLTLPSATNVDEGATLTVTELATGSPVLACQWYDLTAGAALPGETNATLVISNISAAEHNGHYLDLTVTNIYGQVTSGTIEIIVATSPVLAQDITPLSPVIVAGSSLTFSAGFFGHPPFTYGWQFNGNAVANGGRIAGANSNILTISDVQLTDAGTYQLFVTNADGNSQSSPATLTVVPYLQFSGGASWSSQGTSLSWPATNVLQLTDSAGGEINSAFYGSPLYVGAFQASFTYQCLTGTGGADGATFCIQNDPRGLAAIGGGGGNLGVTTITPSVELELNIFAGNGVGGVGISFDTDGAIGPVVTTTPLVINSGDYINAVLTYLNGVATVTLTDTTANTQYSASTNLNIPAVLGTNVAYVGFTGADGATKSTQQISNFSFLSLVDLAIQASGGTAVISWPSEVGAYVLQKSTSLSSTNWVNVTNTINLVNGTNQVVVPITASAQFYQLSLQ